MIVRDLLFAAGSLLFHAVVKTLMRLAQLLHDLFGGNAAREWIVLSEDDMLALGLAPVSPDTQAVAV